jgi:hypothetical protein
VEAIMHIGTFKRFVLVVMGVGFLIASPASAGSKIVIGYQQIVGPYIAAIADGRFDAEVKQLGYEIEWRQFTSAGDTSTALASGALPIGVIGSTGAAATAAEEWEDHRRLRNDWRGIRPDIRQSRGRPEMGGGKPKVHVCFRPGACTGVFGLQQK